jgi:stage II sporulation protein AA (anti-sigma F factor antagonist)
MQVNLTRQENTLCAQLIGELDHHGAGEVREHIDNAVLRQRCRQLILDFSGLTFMDSSGIGLIMGRYRLMASLGGRLSIQGTDHRLENIIRLAGLEKLPIWDDSERKNAHETA